MQVFWDTLTNEVEPLWARIFDEDNDPVYKLVSVQAASMHSLTQTVLWPWSQTMQRVYKWHNHIGAAMVEAVKRFWASEDKYRDPNERKKHIDRLLRPGLLFLFGEVKQVGNQDTWEVSESGPSWASLFTARLMLVRSKVSKTYQGPLVMQALVAHLKDIAPVDDGYYHSMMGGGEPIRALILAITAVCLISPCGATI